MLVLELQNTYLFGLEIRRYCKPPIINAGLMLHHAVSV